MRKYHGCASRESIMAMDSLACYLEEILAVAKITECRAHPMFIDFTAVGITPGKASLKRQEIEYPLFGNRHSLYIFESNGGTVIQFSGVSAERIDTNRLTHLEFLRSSKDV